MFERKLKLIACHCAHSLQSWQSEQAATFATTFLTRQASFYVVLLQGLSIPHPVHFSSKYPETH